MGVITGANRSSGLGTEVTTMARGDQGVTISQSEAREGGAGTNERPVRGAWTNQRP